MDKESATFLHLLNITLLTTYGGVRYGIVRFNVSLDITTHPLCSVFTRNN